ncbi:MAG TPA: hypothetical protein VGN57_11930 [Pirellulaceae bacterium]|jgi:hypothetical protein|nr:hypothetical protein [Pirellulaceae bacterium]
MTDESAAHASGSAAARRQDLDVPFRMSLRDYFAGQALAGLCASATEPANGLALQRRMAETAYQIADAMVARSAE